MTTYPIMKNNFFLYSTMLLLVKCIKVTVSQIVFHVSLKYKQCFFIQWSICSVLFFNIFLCQHKIPYIKLQIACILKLEIYHLQIQTEFTFKINLIIYLRNEPMKPECLALSSRVYRRSHLTSLIVLFSHTIGIQPILEAHL